jgi:hypothetical protein
MPFPITLQQDEYETLVELARRSTFDSNGQVLPDKARDLESWLVGVELASGIRRHSVWVQWQELDAPLPPGTSFPEQWPPSMRTRISFTSRAVTRSDVDVMLASKARHPSSILVTRDPGAIVGWTELDVFFK